MMEISGLCTICHGVAKPAFSCRLCGAIVCSRCYDKETGICINCKSKGKQL